MIKQLKKLMTFFNEKRPPTGCDKRGEDVLREADKSRNYFLESDG